MFAVIKTGGKQYRVAANDVLKVEKVDANVGDIVEFGQVLAFGEGDQATVGVPFVDGAMVTADVVEQGRGDKVIAFKKRRRQNSRRKRGHRQHLTTVRISEILTGGAKPSKKAAAKPQAAAQDVATEEGAKSARAAKTAKPDAEAPTAVKASKAAKPGKTETASTAAPLFSAPAGDADDLVVIKGIGKVAAGQLKEQGIATFAQLAALTEDDIARIDEHMPFSTDQIKDWREQAKALAK
jgi:large subunit ribosomal protein L21